MTSPRTNHRGWAVVAGCTLGIALSPGALIFYSLGMFVQPIATATGWSPAQITLGASWFAGVLIISIASAGELIDRFGVRRVLLPSAFLFGLSLIAMKAVNSLAGFYGCFVAAAALGAGANSVGYMRAVCSWFDRQRGLAVGIASSGMGLSVMIMPQVTHWLLSRWDWKSAYAFLGLLVLVAVVPTAFLLVHEQPQTRTTGASSRAASAQLAGFTVREALHSARFWMLLGAFALLSAAVNSTAVHLVPIVERSTGTAAAVAAASAFGAAMALTRPIAGWLLDRLFAPRVAACVLAGSAAGLVLLMLATENSASILAAALVGISAGADGDLLTYLVSRYMGQRSFAALSSYIFSAYLIGASVAPWLMAIVTEQTGSYAPILSACACALLVSGALLLGLGPFPSFRAADTSTD